jgi:drug/metabolite transporter (DMT)-like permease
MSPQHWTRTGSNIPWQIRFVALGSIWGMSFLLIKVGDEGFSPLQVALGRLVFGTGTLLLILLVRRIALPRGRSLWFHVAVAAILLNALPYSLFAYGETHTTSVLAGICNATVPLFTAPVAFFMLPGERLSRERLAGVILGFMGVLVVLDVWRGAAGGELLGDVMCLGAAISYAFGFPYTRKYLTGRADSMLAVVAAQLLCGSIELVLVTPFLGGLPTTLPLKSLGSVLALGVVGTGIAYVLQFGLIRDAGATVASTVAYLILLVSVCAGILVLHEPLAWYQPVGAIVVMVGVLASQGKLQAIVERTNLLKWIGYRTST